MLNTKCCVNFLAVLPCIDLLAMVSNSVIIEATDLSSLFQMVQIHIFWVHYILTTLCQNVFVSLSKTIFV